MATAAIEIDNLSKDYPFGFLHLKKKTSLEGLTMTVEDGEVFGFLGPNGAGKSTTIKLLVGLIFPTAGTARILGKSINDISMHRDIGYLPEQPYFYDYLTASELLDYFARFHEFTAAERRDRVGVIVGGKLRGVGAPDEMVDMKPRGMEILFEYAVGDANLHTLLSKATQTGKRYRLQVAEEEVYTTLEQLRGAGAKILSMTQVKATLEEYFMHLVEADRAQAAAVEVSGK